MASEKRLNAARILCSLYDQIFDPNFDVHSYNNQVMEIFRQWRGRDSFPPADFIEYGGEIAPTDPDARLYGFKVKGSQYTYISHILNMLEQADIPEVVQERYPWLTKEQWSAAMKIAHFIVEAFNPVVKTEEEAE